MQTLPVFLDVQGRRCLLVGCGEIAARKRRLLERAGAMVVPVADDCSAGLLDHLLADVALVVAASDNEALNEAVSRAARARQLPVNVVDRPELCTFIFPSIVERGPITVAVSSGGAMPVLTRLLRARIETLLPVSLGAFAESAAAFRQQVRNRLPTMQQRMRFWDQLLQRELIGGDLDNLLVAAPLAEQLEQFLAGSTAVHLAVVGAGPGNPDLLTFRALRYLQGCDRLFFDPSVASAIVDLARRDAHQQCLQAGDNPVELIQAAVQAGEQVVWLKAGDPLSYREMPSMLALLQANAVDFVVVPGIIDQSGAPFHAT